MENENTARIGQDFTLKSLFLFGLPGLLTNLFARMFESLDDGLFISRFVGHLALAGIKILGPLDALNFAFSHIFAVGASTVAAHQMGKGSKEEASVIFTKMIRLCFIFGVGMALVFNIFAHPILSFLGAGDDISGYGLIYIRSYYSFISSRLCAMAFAAFYSTSGNPKMTLVESIVNGVMNIVLDILFIVVLKMGVLGTALANTISSFTVFMIGLIFFMNDKREIHFVKTDHHYIDILKECWLTSFPQVLNSASFGFTSFVSNRVIIYMLGSEGVAAQAIIQDIRRILASSFIGFAGCIGPIMAYNYGARNKERISRYIRYTMQIWFIGTSIFTIGGFLLRKPMLSIYMSADTSANLMNMALEGLTIELFSTAFVSGSILINRIFVSFRNTKVATFLSIMRNIVFKLLFTIACPVIMGDSGIWWSFLISELVAFTLGSTLFYLNRDNYGYGKSGTALLLDEN
ncbi:MAG: MATE family efflux transporter [Erysipelotrichaceae bacterium]|nr:MATE family efflux transporter [Erysipelotrichaceae bacterium]